MEFLSFFSKPFYFLGAFNFFLFANKFCFECIIPGKQLNLFCFAEANIFSNIISSSSILSRRSDRLTPFRQARKVGQIKKWKNGNFYSGAGRDDWQDVRSGSINSKRISIILIFANDINGKFFSLIFKTNFLLLTT